MSSWFLRLVRSATGRLQWTPPVGLNWGNLAREFRRLSDIGRTLYDKTRKGVATKLIAATLDQDRGVPATPHRETVGNFLRRWIEGSIRPAVRPSTFGRSECIVRNHLVPTVGRCPKVAQPEPPGGSGSLQQ